MIGLARKQTARRIYFAVVSCNLSLIYPYIHAWRVNVTSFRLLGHDDLHLDLRALTH
jgi:hypothetical protein